MGSVYQEKENYGRGRSLVAKNVSLLISNQMTANRRNS